MLVKHRQGIRARPDTGAILDTDSQLAEALMTAAGKHT